MKQFLLVAFLVLACSVPAEAQDRGPWNAGSSSAQAITGDIVIADGSVTINFLRFPLAQIRKLTQAELGAVFDVDSNTATWGNLYRLNIPAEQRFAHKNTLCGSEQAQWMATYVEYKTLHIAFFSGPEIPSLTFEAINNGTNLCGVFTYSR